MKINNDDLKALIVRVINESSESPFQIESAEGKLEFLISRIQDLINDLSRDVNGDSVYYKGRLTKILSMVGVPITESNSLGEAEDCMSEDTLTEYRPNSSFDTWANLETGGAHGRGIQNRKNFTRKENSRGENVTELTTASDYIKLIYQWGVEGDSEAQKLFNNLLKKYKKGILTLSDLNKIAVFEPIQDRVVVNMLSEFVKSEEEKTNTFGWKHGAQEEPNLIQQPR